MVRGEKDQSRTAYAMRFVDNDARYSHNFLKGIYNMLDAAGDNPQTNFGFSLDKLSEGQRVSEAFGRSGSVS